MLGGVASALDDGDQAAHRFPRSRELCDERDAIFSLGLKQFAESYDIFLCRAKAHEETKATSALLTALERPKPPARRGSCACWCAVSAMKPTSSSDHLVSMASASLVEMAFFNQSSSVVVSKGGGSGIGQH